MKEVKLGDFVIIRDEAYKCVKFIYAYDSTGGGCGFCDFAETAHCNQYDCSEDVREDLTEAMFSLYDNILEDTQIV